MSDVTRTGEWSPVCRACWWYEDAGPHDGTYLPELWTFLPAGLAGFRDRYGDDTDTQIAERTDAAHRGIPETLAAIKAVAESSRR